MCYFRESTGSPIYIERQIPIEPEVHEMYIELMCQLQADRVCPYVKAAEGYRLEETLEVLLLLYPINLSKLREQHLHRYYFETTKLTDINIHNFQAL